MSKKTTLYARKRAMGHAAERNNGITMTRMLNTRLAPREIDRILAPCRAALQAFREARACYEHWVVLCTAAHVAQAIEDGGIVRGQRWLIDEAELALDSIGERCGREADTWSTRPCTGPEIAALVDLVAAHSRQVRELTYGEYKRAADLAVARVATVGGQVFKCEATTTQGAARC